MRTIYWEDVITRPPEAFVVDIQGHDRWSARETAAIFQRLLDDGKRDPSRMNADLEARYRERLAHYEALAAAEETAARELGGTQ